MYRKIVCIKAQVLKRIFKNLVSKVQRYLKIVFRNIVTDYLVIFIDTLMQTQQHPNKFQTFLSNDLHKLVQEKDLLRCLSPSSENSVGMYPKQKVKLTLYEFVVSCVSMTYFSVM